MIDKFAPSIDFPKAEHEILDFWDKEHIFEKSVEERPTSQQFVFFDGPPFATGLPHYGHFIPNILKDVIPRYWTMKGYRVERRFGWDCHGLPVEHEIDKSLGLESRKAIEDFGIDKYNESCRSIVLKYTQEWEKTIRRIGRWVNFNNSYKTMDLKYMESVWWVFKSIWNQGLIYEGYKVMPYSTACTTPLSNFEANLNYKEIQSPSLTVLFESVEQDNTFFLAWTTTPWTLPSNLALTVHPEEEYIEIYDKKLSKNFILAHKRLSIYYPDSDLFEIKEKFPGKKLVGRGYKPLFPYFVKTENAFAILSAEFVTMEDGTGIVHMAPGFGEDDFQVCQKNNIPIVCPIDDDGKFTQEVFHYKGMYVKDTDKSIIQILKERGLLLRQETIQHSYPFCWRSETPLIYRAICSWFIKVEEIKKLLIECNGKTNWVPEHLKLGRFGKWLEGARDWAISRNRYWGCPIPVWKNEVSGKTICIGSLEELEKRTQRKFSDIHRHFIDTASFSINGEKGVYKRVSEVLDCWFESGSMPYAQAHYPFENKKDFEKNFPADFIAEGLDQTRGWFYTLSVLGSILFKKSPFKNVIVNGLLLAEDGKKMSKRLKNYPDPSLVLEKYGADALRLYLINSPAVRAEEFRFSEKGVEDVVRRVLLKWWNSYSFFMSYAQIEKFTPHPSPLPQGERVLNIFDRWILSRLQTLIQRYQEEMEKYHVYNVVPILLDFIEELTNTYIRINRKRFWSEEASEDKKCAFETLYEVLLQFTKIMAPFTPFLSERIYQQLWIAASEKKTSVHLDFVPQRKTDLIDLDLENTIARMQNILVMGRNLREKIGAKIKIPLKSLTIIHRDPSVLKLFSQRYSELEEAIREELNVKTIVYDSHESMFIKLQATPNHKILGPRFGSKMKNIIKSLSTLSHEDILKLEAGEVLTISGEKISSNDIQIQRQQQKGHEMSSSNQFITIDLDPTIDQEQILEGQSREIVSRIQKMRKNANLNLDDRIQLQYRGTNRLAEAIEKNKNYIQSQVLARSINAVEKTGLQHTETFEIDGEKIELSLEKI
ncbi:MAG: isoleucine--tRNA ligase [Deltaproteobacteria bacterium]|nr:isoleucine--tRNA ligase [Deltaproteobacteria bacterium]